MQQFASVALFRRNGQMTFRAPMRQNHDNVTQARKAASRVWNGAIRAPDKLVKIVVVHREGLLVNVSEKAISAPSGQWIQDFLPPAKAAEQPHLAACLKELGINPAEMPPPMPDVLEINGAIYRREI